MESLAPRFELALKMKLLNNRYIFVEKTCKKIYLNSGASVDMKRYQ
jgi:hypothetical protein